MRMEDYEQRADQAVESSEDTEYVTDHPGSIGFEYESENVVGEENIRIDGETITLRVEEVPIGKLKLDPDNPRIYSGQLQADEEGYNFTNGDIEQYIIENSDVSELADDIIRNGGLVNPVYVDSSYTVVEGNRRTVALRMVKRRIENGEIVDKGISEFISRVPVRMFPEDTTDEEISLFLGREHITGKRDWPAFEKAKFLYDLYQEKGTYDAVAEDIGYSTGTVGNYIRSYELASEYMDRYGRDENFVFDHFFSAINYKHEISDVVDLSSNWGREEFCSWVYNGYFHNTYDVRKLSKIFDYDETQRLWNQGKSREAFDALQHVHPEEYGEPFKSLAKAQSELKLMDKEDEEQFEEEAFREIAEDVQDILSEHL